MAYHRIPQEVRNVIIRKGQPEDGTTTALRPLPGGARMYPETDVPVLSISVDRWGEICGELPLTSSERAERIGAYDISENQAESILNNELDDLLVEGVEGALKIPAKAWASALLEFGTSKLRALEVAIHLREKGVMTREGVTPLVSEARLEDADELIEWMTREASERGFTPADNSAVESAVDEVLKEREDFIVERGMASIGPLMGVVMGKLGGSADGKIVSKVLRDKISEMLD
jgi:glutamyl-tRNA(Gln) amidotransferase subunit E